MVKRADAATRSWLRDASDELAVAEGCRFDETRGQFVVDWIERYCRLYEGEFAGQPMILHDWQYEVTMRLFGWVRHSEKWGRWVRRFTRASIWIPKKNKKSPTLAAWGLYMLIGDGEPGQKVYFAAKDGKQIKDNAVLHAIEMVRASDELRAECKINEGEHTISHVPSRSVLMPISSNDSRSQKAKEGLNGSAFIDETHVVDAALMRRIDRMGISRSEPLVAQVSSAGDEPEGHGKHERDYGQKVSEGDPEHRNIHYLFVEYAAPQTLTDDELAKDPLKYGKMANPAWGHTIDPHEFLADYNRSKGSQVDLRYFKMYRLNVWQSASNPWLDINDWNHCRRDYKRSELYGEPCGAGLDLAKTRDTTALVLTFPRRDDRGHETYRQLAFYWLPQARAEAIKHLVPYFDWAAEKHITLVPGRVVDFRLIYRQVKKAFRYFDIQRLHFDDHYAEQLVQRLIEEDGLDEEIFRAFPQNASSFTGPMSAFERLVIAGDLEHNGNKVLTWQAGHTKYQQDSAGNMRPVKPKHNDHRTVDGVVAGIMSLEAAMSIDTTPSVYEDRGALRLSEL